MGRPTAEAEGAAGGMTHVSLAGLPRVADAKLPATYETAKAALAECSRIDECADWANKAEALASYARQSKDDTLRKMAERIQARAIRRCGALLRAIKPAQGANQNIRGGTPPNVTRTQAARDAGLSRDQKRNALRIARIPEDEFEAAVESDDPPTVTELAARGTVKVPIVNLNGRDPKEYALASQALGLLRRFEAFTVLAPVEVIVRGTSKREHQQMSKQIDSILAWLKRLAKEIR